MTCLDMNFVVVVDFPVIPLVVILHKGIFPLKNVARKQSVVDSIRATLLIELQVTKGLDKDIAVLDVVMPVDVKIHK